MTNQEMFDEAYMGLYSQGFKKCLSNNQICVYSDGKGNHCAWGWVDQSLGPDVKGYVLSLHHSNIGVAGTLDEKQFDFVKDLQRAHDGSTSKQNMKKLLNDVAKKYNLLVPVLLERKK